MHVTYGFGVRIFNSCKILLEDRRSRLQMDIKANECLYYWYGPPRKSTFDNIDIGVTEGESIQMVLLKEALKSRVAVYKEAIEEAAKAVVEVVVEVAVNAVVEAPLGKLGRLGKPVAIEPDDDESESRDEGAYAAFEDAIEVEDHEASYIEAL